MNVAGTSGAGKTYLIRSFLIWVKKMGPDTVMPAFQAGRKEPIGYDIEIDRVLIHLVGAYEQADTAGCDTIRDVGWVFDYIRQQHDRGMHVLYEGLFMMNMTRGPALAAERQPFYVIQLADPLSVCIASINARREARGEGALLKKENTAGNFKRAANYCDKMRGAGASVIRVKREQALGVLLGTLGFEEHE